MSLNTSDRNLEEIKSIVFQLPMPDLMALFGEIEARLQTAGMMQLAESGFQEWNDPEEDIYDAQP